MFNELQRKGVNNQFRKTRRFGVLAQIIPPRGETASGS